MNTPTYFECTNCHAWGKAPEEFDECKHNVKCPNCHNLMYLFKSNNPVGDGLPSTKENKLSTKTLVLS